jgi:hypothetical protein
VRHSGATETACAVGCVLLVGIASAGCAVYGELSSPRSDASRERNGGEAFDGGSDGPTETSGADGHPDDAVVPVDAAMDAGIDVAEDEKDGETRDAGGPGIDASVDLPSEDRDGLSDGADPTDADDVVDGAPDASDGPDAGFDIAGESDAPFDVGDVSDADAGGARDAFETGTTTPGLIDDMEDNDSFILSREGRQGVWFVVNDGTPGAVQTPGAPFVMTAIPSGRGASLYAARSTGHGFASWRPLMGFWFHQPTTGPKQAYDVSRYRGITFFARFAASDAAMISPSLRVVVPVRATDPDGMVCTGGGCNDHFGANIALTPEWTSYTILFGAMTQEGWGTQAGQFDAENAYGVEFEFPIQATFDCWIDDIAFVP